MSVSLGANGTSYNYPETGDLSWGSNATNFASAVSAAITKLGLGSSLTASAVIDIVSTTKGIRIPSMTTTQRDAISSPVSGLLVFNTTLNTLDVYYSSAWYPINVNNSPNWGTTLATKAPSETAVKAFMPQTIFDSNQTQNISTSTTYADVLKSGSTWEVSITPKISSSKIAITANIAYFIGRASEYAGFGVKIQKKVGAGAYSDLYLPITSTAPFDAFTNIGGATQVEQYGHHVITVCYFRRYKLRDCICE